MLLLLLLRLLLMLLRLSYDVLCCVVLEGIADLILWYGIEMLFVVV
jgi:hypothetical protein